VTHEGLRRALTVEFVIAEGMARSAVEEGLGERSGSGRNRTADREH